MALQTATKQNIETTLNNTGIIYKHSPRCGMSASRKEVLDAFLEENDVDVYLVDVLGQKDLSQYVEEKTGVKHESPQILCIKNSEVISHFSHMSITPEKLDSVVSDL